MEPLYGVPAILFGVENAILTKFQAFCSLFPGKGIVDVSQYWISKGTYTAMEFNLYSLHKGKLS